MSKSISVGGASEGLERRRLLLAAKLRETADAIERAAAEHLVTALESCERHASSMQWLLAENPAAALRGVPLTKR